MAAAEEIKAELAETPLPTRAKQTVDPWNVQGEVQEDGTTAAINYNKLVEEFGTKLIDQKLLDRFEKVTGRKPHRYLRRGIVFSHREFEAILDRHEKKQPWFLYTGRGPSSDSIHLGHTTPMSFTQWLQEVFDVPLVLMLTDDEKYYFKDNLEIADVKKYSRENSKDIIACGFDPKKTFFFSDYQLFATGAAGFYENVTKVAKRVTVNQAKAVFGFTDSSSIGKVFFGSIQAAAAFGSSFPHIFGEGKVADKIPCLIPCAIDQDPYFRVTRDVAPRAGLAKPSLLHSRFLDGLSGPGSKMSASIDSSAIFMTDTPNQIKNKINKHAFSGGREFAEEQRKYGGNPDVDVSFQYLTFFLEDDDELERIRKAYKSGEMLTGELKKLCITELQTYVKDFQDRRAKVTDADVDLFMAKRELEWPAKASLAAAKPAANAEGGKAADGDGKMSKSQLKKIEKEKQIEEKKRQKAAEKAAKEAAAAAGTT